MQLSRNKLKIRKTGKRLAAADAVVAQWRMYVIKNKVSLLKMHIGTIVSMCIFMLI